MENQNDNQNINKIINPIENKICAPIGNENQTVHSNSNRSNENVIQNVIIIQNENDAPNINNFQNQSVNQRQDVYSRCFKVLNMIIECIFCIAFIVFEKVIKEKDYFFDAHYTAIATITAFFFIFFILFIVEIILFCVYKKNCSFCGIVLFWFSQILYFTAFILIPTYYGRIIYTNSDIKGNYITLIIISQIFTLFIIFIDFIIINLYKDLCCEMDGICDNTFEFLNNFGRCIKDIISRVICQSKNEEDEDIQKIVKESGDQKKQMNDLKEEIKHLLSQHIDIVIDNSNKN